MASRLQRKTKSTSHSTSAASETSSPSDALSAEDVSSLINSAVKSAVSDVISSVKDASVGDTFMPKQGIKFELEGIEIQYRCLEEQAFYMAKAKEYLDKKDGGRASEFVQKALDLTMSRKKDVMIANKSGWGVVKALRSFDSSEFSEKEKADIERAESKVALLASNSTEKSFSGSQQKFFRPQTPAGFGVSGPGSFSPFSQPQPWFGAMEYGMPFSPGMGFRPPVQTQRDPFNVICFKCQLPGHKADQCWAQNPYGNGRPKGAQATAPAMPSAQQSPAGIWAD